MENILEAVTQKLLQASDTPLEEETKRWSELKDVPVASTVGAKYMPTPD